MQGRGEVEVGIVKFDFPDNLHPDEVARLKSEFEHFEWELKVIERRRGRLNNTTDLVALVVLGHFEIERAVEDAIRESLPQRLDFKSFDRFPQKTALLYSIGVSDAKMHNLLIELNKLRNKVAHPSVEKLEAFDVTESDISDILNAANAVVVRGLKLGPALRRRTFSDNLRFLYDTVPLLLFLSSRTAGELGEYSMTEPRWFELARARFDP